VRFDVVEFPGKSEQSSGRTVHVTHPHVAYPNYPGGFRPMDIERDISHHSDEKEQRISIILIGKKNTHNSREIYIHAHIPS